jgi:hypothetical protein
MNERRAFQRTCTPCNAKIQAPRVLPAIHCTVNNMTNAGACLTLASTYGLPTTFDLSFEHGFSRRVDRVIWRTANKLGVAFVRDERASNRQASITRHLHRAAP